MNNYPGFSQSNSANNPPHRPRWFLNPRTLIFAAACMLGSLHIQGNIRQQELERQSRLSQQQVPRSQRPNPWMSENEPGVKRLGSHSISMGYFLSLENDMEAESRSRGGKRPSSSPARPELEETKVSPAAKQADPMLRQEHPPRVESQAPLSLPPASPSPK